MAYVLYYSSYCVQCQRLLRILSEAPPTLRNQIHFVNVDSRRRDPATGKLVVVLDSGAQMILPPNIQRVPAMIAITKGNRVFFGSEDILNYLQTGGAGGGTGASSNPLPSHSTNRMMPPGKEMTTSSSSSSVDFVASNALRAPGQPPVAPGDVIGVNLGSTGDSGCGLFLGVFTDGVTSPSSGGSTSIPTPEEDYSRQKLGSNVTIEKLIAARNADIPPPVTNMPGFTPALPLPPLSK
jgi:hypothetical protein